MRMISFNRRYVAGSESNLRLLDPQSDSLSILGTQLQGIHEPPQNQQNGHCAQRRHRSTCASAQSDQSLRRPLEEILGPQLPTERTTKTLIRLGGSEFSLGTEAFCWFYYEVAHIQKVHPYLR